MYLKVIGNSEDAATKMGTKAILSKGQVLSGPEHLFKELIQNHPELFKEVAENGSESPLKPQKNKLMQPKMGYKTF